MNPMQGLFPNCPDKSEEQDVRRGVVSDPPVQNNAEHTYKDRDEEVLVLMTGGGRRGISEESR